VKTGVKDLSFLHVPLPVSVFQICKIIQRQNVLVAVVVEVADMILYHTAG
jgi:putative effector of murein hydrolase LrgA (UPF0299 family)